VSAGVWSEVVEARRAHLRAIAPMVSIEALRGAESFARLVVEAAGHYARAYTLDTAERATGVVNVRPHEARAVAAGRRVDGSHGRRAVEVGRELLTMAADELTELPPHAYHGAVALVCLAFGMDPSTFAGGWGVLAPSEDATLARVLLTVARAQRGAYTRGARRGRDTRTEVLSVA